MSMLTAKRNASKTQMPQESQATDIAGEPQVSSEESGLSKSIANPESELEMDNEIHFQISRQLIHMRTARKMTQAQLATESKTSQAAIARIENAQENITLSTLKKIVKALRGRFQVSIQPEEFPRQPIRHWWEAPTMQTAGASMVVDVMELGFGFVTQGTTSSTFWMK